MNKHYQLNITSDTTEVNVNTIDPNEIARIVSLAGLPPQAPPAMAPVVPEMPSPRSVMPSMAGGMPGTDIPSMDDGVPGGEMPPMDDDRSCSICGADDHSDEDCPSSITAGHDHDQMELDEEIAEYDHGKKEFTDEGEEVNVDSYVWQGSKLPQRIVKGGQGDNPLISELHAHLMGEYSRYLAEAEADRENEDGILSPLSDATKPGFDKDPFAGTEAVTDGSRSPMSTIKRQHAFK